MNTERPALMAIESIRRLGAWKRSRYEVGRRVDPEERAELDGVTERWSKAGRATDELTFPATLQRTI